MMTLPAYVLNAYLPGRSGSLHTPRSPLRDELAVLVVDAREVRADRARVRDDDADGADLDDGLRDHLDRREQAVDVVRALDEHLELAAARAAGERGTPRGPGSCCGTSRVARIVADDRRDDLALRRATGRRGR